MTPDDIDFVKNALRKASTRWKGRRDCLKRARRKVVDKRFDNGEIQTKYHYQCANCKQWYRDEKSLEVDHIVEIGPHPSTLKGLIEWIDKLFCGPENLQALCSACHMKKTQRYNSALSRWQRK